MTSGTPAKRARLGSVPVSKPPSKGDDEVSLHSLGHASVAGSAVALDSRSPPFSMLWDAAPDSKVAADTLPLVVARPSLAASAEPSSRLSSPFSRPSSPAEGEHSDGASTIDDNRSDLSDDEPLDPTSPKRTKLNGSPPAPSNPERGSDLYEKSPPAGRVPGSAACAADGVRQLGLPLRSPGTRFHGFDLPRSSLPLLCERNRVSCLRNLPSEEEMSLHVPLATFDPALGPRRVA